MDLGDVGAGSSGRGPVPSGQRRRFFPREDQKPEMRVLNVRDVMVCELRETSSPLLDSGATQRLRIARSQDEWRTAEEVNVQLAGAASLRMRMDDKGTLLMPPAQVAILSRERGGSHTIVPLGELVKRRSATPWIGRQRDATLRTGTGRGCS